MQKHNVNLVPRQHAGARTVLIVGLAIYCSLFAKVTAAQEDQPLPTGTYRLEMIMLGNAVFAQAGRAILAVKLLAVENFVPAFTAFDGSVDELKHRLAAQRNAAKKIALF